MKILNGLSLNMLSSNSKGFRIVDDNLTVEQDIIYNSNGMDICHLGFIQSYIGHQDLCDMISHKYGITIPMNRGTAILSPNETAIVFQYIGERLPEGTKVLPQGSTIKVLLIEVL